MRRVVELCRGQTSFELLLFVAFVFFLSVIVVSPFLQIMDETKAIAIVKARAIDLVSQQDEKYVVYEVERNPSPAAGPDAGKDIFVVVLRPLGELGEGAAEEFSSGVAQELEQKTGFDNAAVWVLFEQRAIT